MYIVAASIHWQEERESPRNDMRIEQSKKEFSPPLFVLESKAITIFDPSLRNIADTRSGVGGSAPTAKTMKLLPFGYLTANSLREEPYTEIVTLYFPATGPISDARSF